MSPQPPLSAPAGVNLNISISTRALKCPPFLDMFTKCNILHFNSQDLTEDLHLSPNSLDLTASVCVCGRGGGHTHTVHGGLFMQPVWWLVCEPEARWVI